MFKDGLYCSSSKIASSRFIQIGNLDLIEKRRAREVDCAPGGTLSDYIPFYFTPFTPMMYNIKTGHNGVQKRPSEDIVILVSSLHKLVACGVPFVFSDRHAYLRVARFSNDLGNLDWIPWEALQAREFKKENVDKFERYQAEALVYRHMPLNALLGALCYNKTVKHEIEAQAAAESLMLKVIVRPGWYL